ncbi:hypothetical protein NUM3379_23870 [Kineococcus sp. NUM-3379]
MPVTAEPAPDPVVDALRLAAVAEATSAGAAAGDGLERLVRLAARVLGVPVAMVSFVAGDREVVQAEVGLPEPWASRRTTPLTHSLCAHVVRLGGPVVLYDARADPGYREHAAVVEMGAGAYAGFPLHHAGHTLGAFCAADVVPRRWSPEDLLLLEDLAAAVSAELALRIALRAVEASERRLQGLVRELHEQSRTGLPAGVADRAVPALRQTDVRTTAGEDSA